MDTSLNAINAKIVETLNSVNAEWSDEARGSSQLSRKQMGWPGLSQTWNRGSKKSSDKKATADTAEENAKDEIDMLNDMPQGTSSSDPAREEWNDQFAKALDAIDDIADEEEREKAKDALRDMENVTDVENFIDPRTGQELSESTNWKEEEDFRGGDNDPEFQREEREDMEEQRRRTQKLVEEAIARADANEKGRGDGNEEFQRQEREAMEEQDRSRQEAIEEQIAREESNRRSFEEAAAPGEIDKLSDLDLEEFEILADNPETKQKFADEAARRRQGLIQERKDTPKQRQQALSDEPPTDADTIASNPATLKELSVYEIAEFITESDNPATRKALTDELDRRVAETNP